jgi:hypothetical protein
MEGAPHLEAWHDLYVMLGTSSAALLGLLFVATSLHLNEITTNFSYRTRARNNSLTLIFTLIEATIILTPQPAALLSASLVVANVGFLWLAIRNTYLYTIKNSEIGRSGGWRMWRGIAFILALAIGTAGAVVSFHSMNVGLYVVTASYIAVLVIVTLNAWSVLLGIGQAEQAPKTPARKTRKRKE